MKSPYSFLTGLMVIFIIFASSLPSGPPPGVRSADATAIMERTSRALAAVAQGLVAYERQHGRFPTNDEGLVPLVEGASGCWLRDAANGAASDSTPTTVPTDPAYLLMLVPAGLEDMGGVPFQYENRRGLAAAQFAGSPVDETHRKPSWLSGVLTAAPLSPHGWLVGPAPDVYAYSLTALKIARQDQAAQGPDPLGAVVGLLPGVGLAGLVLFACLWLRDLVRRDAQPSSTGAGALGWLIWSMIGLGGLTSVFTATGCYQVGGILQAVQAALGPPVQYDAEAAAEQTRLLDAFKARGVLKAETCDVLKQAATPAAFAARHPAGR